MIGFACKYAPAELLAGFGLDYEYAQPQVKAFDQSEGLLYPCICGYSKALIDESLRGAWEGLLFTDCCDAMKRAHDVLAREEYSSFLVGLPRQNNSAAVAQYARELMRLIKALEDAMGVPFDEGRFRAALPNKAESAKEDHVVLLGARLPQSLRDLCSSLSPLPVIDMTCAGQGRGFDPPPCNIGLEGLLSWYAAQLLGQPPCMRMADVEIRRSLWENPHCKGIIFHTIKFCDYYGFEYMQIHTEKPVLKLETDYTDSSAGQLRTRLEAYFEANKFGNKRQKPMEKKKESQYFVGIDIGSTSTDVVVLDPDRHIVSQSIVATGAKSGEAAQIALNEVLENAGISAGQVQRIVSTGYGRKAVEFESDNITEISCHAKGAFTLFSDARTIIDIGGQDSKVIRLGPSGNVIDFAMNDKCAAGTGRFLELMARTLGEELEDFAKMGIFSKEELRISSMCAVFAESEVVSLMAQNKEKSSIIHAINASIAGRMKAMCSRLKAEGPYVMTGGVAMNPGVVQALSEALSAEIKISPQAQLAGAYGAALLAME
ncbi:MAG: hypothetical protein PWQ08_968 [Clostridiales bacterium]|nr:hypothetical protein [Clostridiales bacterium]